MPFTSHHPCTASVEWLQQGGKGNLRDSLQSHGSLWIDGGNFVKRTKRTSRIPGFLLSSLRAIFPVTPCSLGDSKSLTVPLDEVPFLVGRSHTLIPAGARQAVKEWGSQMGLGHWTARPCRRECPSQAPKKESAQYSQVFSFVKGS